MNKLSEIVGSLRKQYTLSNDGNGLDGRCRVPNKDLLELLHLAEQAEKQNAELLEAAKDVIKRWDAPLWEERKPTSFYMHKLREAIAKAGRK